MSGNDETNSPVDEPPGKDGHQGQANPAEEFPVPEYEPGTNPPGTHPPVDPEVDPATQHVPGSMPVMGAEAQAPPPGPPVNTEVPYAEQSEGTVSCTMGIWTGEPTAYWYSWTVGSTTHPPTDIATYAVQVDDIGETASCVVTADNAHGSGTAPSSNAVTIA